MNELSRARKKLLQDSRHMTLATVCEDGSPWATPLRYVFDGSQLYWDSAETTVHAQNIARDNRVFVSIVNFDDPAGSRALYLSSRAVILSGEHADLAKKYLMSEGEIDPANGSYYRASIGDIDVAKSGLRRFYSSAKEEE